MSYIICNELQQQYVGMKSAKGSGPELWYITNDINEAYQVSKRKTAYNILNHQLYHNLPYFDTYELAIKDITDISVEKVTEQKPVSTTELNIENKTELKVSNIQFTKDEIESFNYETVINQITTLSQLIKERTKYLADEVSECDKRLQDIEHEAEFNIYNVVDGYRVYKRMHDVRIQRRKVKDELQILGIMNVTTMNNQSIKNLRKAIKGLDSRKYTPRSTTENEDNTKD